MINQKFLPAIKMLVTSSTNLIYYQLDLKQKH